MGNLLVYHCAQILNHNTIEVLLYKSNMTMIIRGDDSYIINYVITKEYIR